MPEQQDKPAQDGKRTRRGLMRLGNGQNGRAGLLISVTGVVALMANVAYLGYFTGKYSERIDNMKMRLALIPHEIPPATVTDRLSRLEVMVDALERKCDSGRWDSGDLGGGGK